MDDVLSRAPTRTDWRKVLIDGFFGVAAIVTLTALYSLSAQLGDLRTDLRGLSVAEGRDAEDLKAVKTQNEEILKLLREISVQVARVEERSKSQ